MDRTEKADRTDRTDSKTASPPSNSTDTPRRRTWCEGLMIPSVLLVVAALATLVATQVTPQPAQADADDESISQRAYAALDTVRRKKHRQLTAYLNRIQERAHAAGRDETLLACFRLKLDYHRLKLAADPPPEAVQAMQTLSDSTLAYMVQHYRGFTDILFVEPGGTVFHTVRRSEHRGRNLVEGPLKGTSLARRLQESPTKAFVDYEHSGLSQVPSAFFVEPVLIGGSFRGWFVLQCSIHNINSIFTRDTLLGQSGETFLVNQDCQMLTDSRFRREPSILSLHLSPANIKSKFAEQSGHKLVVDYRGVRAMTSFKVCPVMGSRWLLVAKIDEAEVLTNHYRRHRRRLQPQLIDAARRQTGPATVRTNPPRSEGAIMVGMDEFRRATPGETLVTLGVNTCTAVVAYLPGEFAYLGHVSNYDALYGGNDVDLLSNMLSRIRTYEICPYKLRQLRVVLVAPHTDSLGPAIDRLTEQGIFLSQIRFLHRPQAASAEVRHDVTAGKTFIRWNAKQASLPPVFQQADTADDLGDIARRLWIKTPHRLALSKKNATPLAVAEE